VIPNKLNFKELAEIPSLWNT